MKVVLFCGGLGTRLREHSETVPKPLVPVGVRPIVWHLMRYYAHHGHRDFILCLGYRGHMIREYFLNYQEAMSNDFTLSDGGRRVELHSSDLDGWRITFVDTGLNSNIGQRLLRVRHLLKGEDMFLANYADGLSNLPLDQQIEDLRRRDAIASFVSVQTRQTFHAVRAGADGVVSQIGPIGQQNMLINGGFFVLRQQIFDYIEDGDELVEQPFARLIEERKLATFPWHGFWQCMDTFKDKTRFDEMEAAGDCPWMVWRQPPAERALLPPPPASNDVLPPPSIAARLRRRGNGTSPAV
jgi:glucose-1-phosphate cytidylyltransferase